MFKSVAGLSKASSIPTGLEIISGLNYSYELLLGLDSYSLVLSPSGLEPSSIKVTSSLVALSLSESSSSD